MRKGVGFTARGAKSGPEGKGGSAEMRDAGASPAGAVYKILVVDDSPVVRGTIKKH